MLHDTDLVSIQEARAKVDRAYAASRKLATFTQEQLDTIVEHAAAAACAETVKLAEMAVEETGMGNVPDKIAKNLLNSEWLPKRMRGLKLVGLMREVPEEGMVEYGVPVGVVAAVLPTTNPTSTAIFKTLISLKAGNAIVISPHPRAKNCTAYTADLLYRAALEKGAPEDCVQCLSNPTLEATQAMMQHKRTGVILSTGGAGIVRAAYSSGKPAFGVGAGNVPVLIDPSADIPAAVAMLIEGKAFDYGTVCSSEQVLVAEKSIRDAIIGEMKRNNVYFCDAAQAAALEKTLFTPQGTVSAPCVGQSPQKIAQLAGFSVPENTSILVVELAGVGRQHRLSAEKLSPVLSMYFVDTFDQAVEACAEVIRFGGLGHTAGVYAKDDARIRALAERLPAFRVLVNTPTPSGSTGVTTNVWPSMTLGCGAMGGNITSDNVGPQHLVNIKRLAYAVRKAEEAFVAPPYQKGKAAAPAPQPVMAATGVDRQAVAAAVEKYLASRGIPVTPAVPAPPAAAPVRPAAAAAPVSEIVDKFLASRRPATATEAAPPCGCPSVAAAPCSRKAAEEPAAEPTASIPAPKINIVDFVCENDVRDAIRESRKIYIGPRTIVTPAARELADPLEVIVMAKRS